jgi:hypothetical protein
MNLDISSVEKQLTLNVINLKEEENENEVEF